MTSPNQRLPNQSDNAALQDNSAGETTTTQAEAPECRFRLDTTSSDTVVLPDGRVLSYAQYGSLTGSPVLYLHGLPGCRLEAALFHDAALELGARIISVDRPGIGRSSPHPGRKLIDYPKDLEFLADHLKLEEYRIVGISGGGPNALACARAMPAERLKCVAVVCGLGPPDMSMKDAEPMHKYLFRLAYRHFPTLTKWYFGRQPAGRLDLTDEERVQMLVKDAAKNKSKVHEKEYKVMTDLDVLRLHVFATREAFAPGLDGFVQDGNLMCVDWGFRIEDIRRDLPVHIWHGKFDVFVPPTHGEQVAQRLGRRARLWMEDETHSSISAYRHKDFFEALLHDG